MLRKGFQIIVLLIRGTKGISAHDVGKSRNILYFLKDNEIYIRFQNYEIVPYKHLNSFCTLKAHKCYIFLNVIS